MSILGWLLTILFALCALFIIVMPFWERKGRKEQPERRKEQPESHLKRSEELGESRWKRIKEHGKKTKEHGKSYSANRSHAT